MLTITNLSFTYPDGHQGTCAINLQVKPGETIALIGANGAGKSTLLSLLVGIFPATKGEIRVDDITLNKNTIKQIRQKIGIVFQNPDDQLFMPTVYDDVAFGVRNLGYDKKQTNEIVLKTLDSLNITHLKDRISTKLSGGEKRIVSVASVLGCNPSIILFDEPTAFLDPMSRKNCMSLMKDLPVTKIIATHDLDMALDLCDRVIVLKDGRVYADRATEDILYNEDLLKQCGLLLPLCIKR